jgi:hypothetical protein
MGYSAVGEDEIGPTLFKLQVLVARSAEWLRINSSDLLVIRKLILLSYSKTLFQYLTENHENIVHKNRNISSGFIGASTTQLFPPKKPGRSTEIRTGHFRNAPMLSVSLR